VEEGGTGVRKGRCGRAREKPCLSDNEFDIAAIVSLRAETEIGYERKRQYNAIKYSYNRGRVPEGEGMDALFIGEAYYNNDKLIIEG